MPPPQFALCDVELTGLQDYSEVRALTQAALDIPGVGSVDDIKNIYCGSPMQDTLALSQSKADDECVFVRHKRHHHRSFGNGTYAAPGMSLTSQGAMVPPPGTMSAECSILPDNERDDLGRVGVDVAMIWGSRTVDKNGVDEPMNILKDVSSE
ncbi:hypothetical protein BDV26DRAFT_297219 [Aspergillus bertholletiae]|uniref:Uncharacterized protein n=1 Tax=Aspergillus bertholletiae TaxID=1226010 RepID=A0A5N7ATF6_9EURO|nr:hypothetical protein BDV26DRAFT_297219 [Aspergillus bertholletiae]